MRSAAVTFVVCVLAAGLDAPLAQASDFWDSLRQPGLSRYRTALVAGKAHMDRGEWAQAVTQLQRASDAMPALAEAHRLRGNGLKRLDRPADAVEAWTRARSLDPLLAHDPQLTFDFAVALAASGRSSDTIDEYRRLLATTGPGHRLRAPAFARCAEALMASGPEYLDEAVAYFRSAVAESPRLVFAGWGLALALDRAGQDGEAASVLERLRRDDPRLAVLADEDTFFSRPEEAQAVRGLGLEAFGNAEAALAAWRAFLDAGGENGPWGDAARRHVDRLEERIATAPSERANDAGRRRGTPAQRAPRPTPEAR